MKGEMSLWCSAPPFEKKETQSRTFSKFINARVTTLIVICFLSLWKWIDSYRARVTVERNRVKDREGGGRGVEDAMRGKNQQEPSSLFNGNDSSKLKYVHSLRFYRKVEDHFPSTIIGWKDSAIRIPSRSWGVFFTSSSRRASKAFNPKVLKKGLKLRANTKWRSMHSSRETLILVFSTEPEILINMVRVYTDAIASEPVTK